MSFGICFFSIEGIFFLFFLLVIIGRISVWFFFLIFFSQGGRIGEGHDGDFFEGGGGGGGGVLREQTKNEGLFFMINDSLKRDIIGSVFVYLFCLFNLFVCLCVVMELN